MSAERLERYLRERFPGEEGARRWVQLEPFLRRLVDELLDRIEQLEKGLRAVETHHALLNRSKGRAETRSRTLRMVREALAQEAPRPRGERCQYHTDVIICKNGCCHKCVEASGKKCNHAQ